MEVISTIFVNKTPEEGLAGLLKVKELQVYADFGCRMKIIEKN